MAEAGESESINASLIAKYSGAIEYSSLPNRELILIARNSLSESSLHPVLHLTRERYLQALSNDDSSHEEPKRIYLDIARLAARISATPEVSLVELAYIESEFEGIIAASYEQGNQIEHDE